MGQLKTHGALLLLSVTVAVTTGCIPTEQQLLMEREILDLKGRLTTLERGLETLREGRIDETSQRIETIARQQADQQAALDGLRVEFQGTVGRLDDATNDRNQLREDMSLIRDDLDLRLASLEKSLTAPPDNTLAPPPPPAPEPSPQEFYNQGLALIREQGDFVAGRKILVKFLDEFPSSELRPNALYWIGEAYYAEKSFENAIVQFQDVVDSFPGHPKAAAALLKQGLSFQAMGDTENAQSIYLRLVEKYPESEEAKKASLLLEEKAP